ncbi:MAG: alpha-L-rhamnosidase-related protein [Armatimonadota bacterium]
MTYTKPADATEGAYGSLITDAHVYRPLDEVTVRIRGRHDGDTRCTVRVCDLDQQPYFETTVELVNNAGEAHFLAGGKLGVHYVYLYWPDGQRHSRYCCFQVECETAVETGDADFDSLYPYTRDAVRCGRREYDTRRGKMVGYMSADTWHFDGIWLRDWIYGVPAYRFWEREMSCGLDRFMEEQSPQGMIPDGIERDGHTWRVGLESDVEYIFAMGVWQTWQATGDDAWLAKALPKVKKALRYVTSAPRHWDARHRLVKRQHSCDTWDFDIDGAGDSGDQRHIIANCDQSGYLLAFNAVSAMCRHLGQAREADAWARKAEAYRGRASTLLWDGVKFLHHVHLDAIDHADFDESQQLTMGNTWAMTRGLATPQQARSIIDEYRRRHAETGDAYPWWSLQPGYPDHLNYFRGGFRKQGGYANGGLMPWVGGELCRASFQNGREAYGVELLRQYADHLRRTGGAHVWYWPDGEPGFRTTNEVNYATWGMSEWLVALTEGLAGVRDDSCLFRNVEVSPRWAAAGIADARVITRYAASRACFTYRQQIEEKAITITYTGSGDTADFRVLLPAGYAPKEVTLNGDPITFTVRHEDQSAYACFTTPVAGVGRIQIFSV